LRNEQPIQHISFLQINVFNLSSESVLPAFLFPMYLILLNLPMYDLIGSSALFPQLIKEILKNSGIMQYSACVAQAFFIHIYAAGTVFNLSAMAYDRYIAICYPLQYSTVMTNAHIMRIITIVWMSCLVLIAVLFFLLLRLPRCRSEMTHVYCDNPSLVLGLFTIISYRLNNVSPHFRRFMGLKFREKVLNFLKNRMFSS
uniref:G-protein coupled receptors family 1 profile domain-containing protein n=1 Tax=Maylandia zebra TaxID=106582 RepID=A0A3P9BU54_9CICH